MPSVVIELVNGSIAAVYGNVVLVALYRDMKNWEDLAPCPHCGAILPVGAQFCPDCGKEI